MLGGSQRQNCQGAARQLREPCSLTCQSGPRRRPGRHPGCGPGARGTVAHGGNKRRREGVAGRGAPTQTDAGSLRGVAPLLQLGPEASSGRAGPAIRGKGSPAHHPLTSSCVRGMLDGCRAGAPGRPFTGARAAEPPQLPRRPAQGHSRLPWAGAPRVAREWQHVRQQRAKPRLRLRCAILARREWMPCGGRS